MAGLGGGHTSERWICKVGRREIKIYLTLSMALWDIAWHGNASRAPSFMVVAGRCLTACLYTIGVSALSFSPFLYNAEWIARLISPYYGFREGSEEVGGNAMMEASQITFTGRCPAVEDKVLPVSGERDGLQMIRIALVC